jgi:hypothetical protein
VLALRRVLACGFLCVLPSSGAANAKSSSDAD